MIAFLAAARAIHLASLMSIFGASVYGLLLRRADLGEPSIQAMRILLLTAATLALASGILWFCLIAGQMSGSWLNSADLSTLELAGSSTRFGQIFVARVAGLIGLWFMCLSTRVSARAVAILAGLLLASLGPVSHAAAMNGDIAFAGAANDALHLLSAGFWLGGLMVLVLLIPQHWRDPAALLGPLKIFSVWGTLVVALLVATGLINAFSIVPFSPMSLHTSYFGLLSVKVGLALVMIALAALNRWRFAPRLRSGGDEALRSLTASIRAEIVVGIIVVAIASCLGLTSPH